MLNPRTVLINALTAMTSIGKSGQPMSDRLIRIGATLAFLDAAIIALIVLVLVFGAELMGQAVSETVTNQLSYVLELPLSIGTMVMFGLAMSRVFNKKGLFWYIAPVIFFGVLGNLAIIFAYDFPRFPATSYYLNTFVAPIAAGLSLCLYGVAVMRRRQGTVDATLAYGVLVIAAGVLSAVPLVDLVLRIVGSPSATLDLEGRVAWVTIAASLFIQIQLGIWFRQTLAKRNLG